MRDTFYRIFDYGYLPEQHDDVIDLAQTYFDHPTSDSGSFGAIVHDGRKPGDRFQTVHLESPLRSGL